MAAKKSIKMTTMPQFQTLVGCMEQYPQLATGAPQFGSSKNDVDNLWEVVANKVNALGPPNRCGSEWKKIWADLKCRVKKKIAENSKNLYQTGGGPCRVSNLTELENDIDSICYLSAAAAPAGKVYGVCKKNVVTSNLLMETTPPRSTQRVAVVTPTNTSQNNMKKTHTITSSQQPEPTEIFTPLTKESCESLQKVGAALGYSSRKRKMFDAGAESSERIKLLRQQVDIQTQTLNAIKEQSEAMKLQTEATKECAIALKDFTSIFQSQHSSFKVIAESLKLMTKAMFDVVKQFEEK